MKAIQILVYVTSNKDRVIGGDPLCLYIEDDAEKQQLLIDMGRALKANVILLKNGDYMIVNNV